MKQPPAGPEAFAQWLIEHHACEDARARAAEKSLPEIWETCQRGDWLQWLLDKCGYKWSEEVRAKYRRVEALAWAEYERVEAPAWAEYERVTGQAWAEYRRVTGPAWAEYERVTAQAWAEYQRVTGPAWAEYQRVRAQAIRTIIPYPSGDE